MKKLLSLLLVLCLLAGICASAEEAGSGAIPAGEPAAEAKTPVIVNAFGASIQYLDIDGIGAGDTYTSLDFTNDWLNPVTGKTLPGGSASFKVTADNPHSDKIAYWVIDGVRYDFSGTVKSLNITGLTQSMTIECVYRNRKSVTQGAEPYLKQPEPGAALVVECSNAKMRHVKNSTTGNAQPFTRFDFTRDYLNEATGKTVSGGTIDFKVAANTNGNTKVKNWEIDGARIIFNNPISYIIVHGLNVSKTYVAHYDGESDWKPNPGSSSGKASGSSGSGGNQTSGGSQPESNVDMCTVYCTNCTFSGGGFSGATKGDVPVHTVITVRYRCDVKSITVNDSPVDGIVPKRVKAGGSYTYNTFRVEIHRYTRIVARY